MFGLSKENITKDQVNEWITKGILTQDQANKILAEINENRKTSDSNRFILIISGLGVLSLFIGAISFLVMNWQQFGIILKSFIFISSTLISLAIGYYFSYVNQNYKVVGTSLIFLSSLLFGGTLLQLSQYYNENSLNHSIFLIWLLGILPIIYFSQSLLVARLSVLLFLTWIFLFLGGFNSLVSSNEFFIIQIPIICSLFILIYGYFHYFTNQDEVGNLYRQDGLKLSLIFLFLILITYDYLSSESSFYLGDIVNSSGQYVLTFGEMFILGLLFIELIASFVLMFIKDKFLKLKDSLFELIAIFSIVVILMFIFGLNILLGESFHILIPLFQIIFNLYFIFISLFVLYTGFKRSNLRVFDLGITCTMLYLIYKYFNLLYNIVDGTLFFTFGGLILIFSGLVIEKNRKYLKSLNVNNFDKVTTNNVQ